MNSKESSLLVLSSQRRSAVSSAKSISFPLLLARRSFRRIARKKANFVSTSIVLYMQPRPHGLEITLQIEDLETAYSTDYLACPVAFDQTVKTSVLMSQVLAGHCHVKGYTTSLCLDWNLNH